MKKLRYVTMLLCLVFLTFCNSKKRDTGIKMDTIHILSMAMDSAVGPDSIYRNDLRLPPMLFENLANKKDSLEHVKFLHWKDSLTAILDTASLFVFIVPQFDSPSTEEVKNILDNSNVSTVAGQMKMEVGAFRNLVRSLAAVEVTSDKVPVNNLTTNFNFIIRQNDSLPKHKLTHLGTVSFSRVAYNKAKDKACIYTSFSCGGKCGHGDILFFERETSHWVCRARWQTWIA